MAVTCFYFDYAARKEQSATSMLGSLLKQMVSGIESLPEEILRAFQKQRKVIGVCGPQLVDIAKMLQLITSSQRTFMVIDALDECLREHQPKLLVILKRILEKSPSTRIFLTGRPYIRDFVVRHLARRVTIVSIVPRKDDIVAYIRGRLSEDCMPDAMDESLATAILQQIPEKIPEMCVWATPLRILPQINC